MSPRPKRRRRLNEPPTVTGFIPESGEFDPENGIVLHFEEYEAIKLADYNNLTQLEASERLQVSRPTFTRIYDSARKKVARAFVENKSISVAGGMVEFDTNWFSCLSCGTVYKEEITHQKQEKICPVCASDEVVAVEDNQTGFRGKGRGRARHSKGGMGMEGSCICPKCDFKVEHEAGVPCAGLLCPKCDIRMLRENSEHHKIILKKRKK